MGAAAPSALAAAVLPILTEVPLTVLIEPGRSIVGPAGLLPDRASCTSRRTAASAS